MSSRFSKFAALAAFFTGLAAWAQDTPSNPQQGPGARGGGGPQAGVYKSVITPHWFAGEPLRVESVRPLRHARRPRATLMV